ncbi:outer membrane protein OmpW [Shewanella sp. SR43-4]|jgi:outer membrane protein|uniref:Outer membrane protein OmpW n=1 Tax=Shewanella vesiculosa TaxID=518738 RepID=A0ABV0FLF0_9GAMM|nr:MULTISPECIES: outer membrane protein OmpW [Shewanella]NCQ46592.1 outer membrane protein OmpW [Shewanella frigidimarina]MBB1319537.1 outer membrane protein OmpW [Shewanella sp. SR43-4]MBB1319995.1 outer membrane protein OmpW [Shewanella sp. SR43-8]MBB1387848.1 outer membrane protein OmpW [Shewanella sp. SG44-6]MBB1477051.1 outer membrane protein OmpW [Shewanella sp. SG41-3]|tara:strand:- start:78 stop:725 length:648 start_codon:yes stop_codon:yes gene_type:complete
MNKKITLSLVAVSLLSAGLSFSAAAHQAGDIIVRAGVAMVAPNESSPVVANVAEFSVDNDVQLGLNFGYMLTDNVGIELLAASPFSHDVSLGALGKIADSKQLPPTLVAQYYFGDSQSALRPYVGLGVNFTNFYDNEFTQDAKDLGLENLSLSNSWGLAAQVGLDYQIDKKWLVNASVWYAQISTDVSFDMGADHVVVDTDIDPWVYMVSVGYTF